MNSERRPQQSDPPTQPLSLRNIGGFNWEWEMQGGRFIEQGVEPDPKAKNKRARTLARALRKLGYEVTITPINLAIAENGMQM